MKTPNYVLAISIVLLVALTSFSFNTFAQSKSKLVADETEIVKLKSSFKVVTSNEKILSLLLSEFQEVKRYTVEIKQDRQGKYKEYAVPFKNEWLDKVNRFFTKINK